MDGVGGIAARAKGMGARVAVVEVDPVRALEALMDGNDVLSMKKLLPGEKFLSLLPEILQLFEENISYLFQMELF